jgi:hypothetical protein
MVNLRATVFALVVLASFLLVLAAPMRWSW